LWFFITNSKQSFLSILSSPGSLCTFSTTSPLPHCTASLSYFVSPRYSTGKLIFFYYLVCDNYAVCSYIYDYYISIYFLRHKADIDNRCSKTFSLFGFHARSLFLDLSHNVHQYHFIQSFHRQQNRFAPPARSPFDSGLFSPRFAAADTPKSSAFVRCRCTSSTKFVRWLQMRLQGLASRSNLNSRMRSAICRLCGPAFELVSVPLFLSIHV
jgi:hypothetical protein